MGGQAAEVMALLVGMLLTSISDAKQHIRTDDANRLRRRRPAIGRLIPRLHDRAKIEQLYMLAEQASSSSQLHRVNGVY